MPTFHRAVIGHRDFTGEDGFKVHTRWIESDFAEPLPDASLVRCTVELDGRRVSLGWPALLLQGLGR